MNTFQKLPERAMELATRVGDGLKDRVPDRAVQWVETGAALGALKTGTRVASRVVRRNPAIFVAAAAGAGLLWYAARRRARRETLGLDSTADNAASEGRSKRVQAKREANSAARNRRQRKGGDEASASTSTH
jgi:hypothetical protein